MKLRIDRKKLFMYLIMFTVGAVLFYLYTRAPSHQPDFTETIYIRADGSVHPQTASIHRDEDLYTFTYNIHGSIVVEKDNIEIDGKGLMIQGRGAKDSKGVMLSGRENVTIRNIEIGGFWYGICLENCSDNSISRNNITASIRNGVWLNRSSNNILSENSVVNNAYGIYLEYSLNNSILGNSIKNNGYGIYLYRSSNNTLSQNIVATNNVYGMWLHESSKFNSVLGNRIVDNGYGIYFLRFSDVNDVFGNIITANEKQGIWLHHSSQNVVAENSIMNNLYGIYLSLGFIGGSSNNLIYHNNFVDNADQIYIANATGTHEPPPPPVNVWDDGLEGNYWSDYTGVDKNNDGIGDSLYLITPLGSQQYDRHPLVGIFYNFNTPPGYDVNVISNSTLEYFEFFESNSTIKVSVSNMTVNQTYGFCRIRIPYALMNGTYHVIVDGLEPYYANYTLYDDGFNRWIYFIYSYSTVNSLRIVCSAED